MYEAVKMQNCFERVAKAESLLTSDSYRKKKLKK